MKRLFFTLLAILFTQNIFACTAGFTNSFSPSGNNLLQVTFTNTSNPGIIPAGQTELVIYRFGDGTSTPAGNYGSISHNYASPGTYTATIVIEIVDSPAITNIHCADSTTASVTVNYSPCGTAFSVSYGSGFSATFTANNPPGTSGMNYSWAFGDGNSGSGSPITHTYSGPGNNLGNYNVTLTATSSLPCSYTNTEAILFANQISGRLETDTTVCYVTNPAFKVWLITYDAASQILAAVDSVIVNGTVSGFHTPYIFYNEAAGNYRVKTMITNGPTTGTGPLPTYSYDSLHWNAADSFIYGGTGASSGHDINLQCGTITSGPGFISGNVTMGANKSTKTTNGQPGIEILISSAVNGNIAYTMTDANGDYSFSNLPVVAGGSTYTIYPEILGYQNTPWNITLYPGTDSVSNASFHIATGSHTTTAGVENISIKEAEINVYPNPTTGLVNIASSVAANAVISDVVGHKVLETAINAGKTQLNLGNLQAGIYFISIKATGLNYTNKIIIQH